MLLFAACSCRNSPECCTNESVPCFLHHRRLHCILQQQEWLLLLKAADDSFVEVEEDTDSEVIVVDKLASIWEDDKVSKFTDGEGHK
jgi:hypothetical protein